MSYHLGIIAYQGHCSTAAVFKDDTLIGATSEERLSRVKEDSQFPLNAIKVLLDELNLKSCDIAHVSFAWDPKLSALQYLKSLNFSFKFLFKRRNNGNSSRIEKFKNMITVKSLLAKELGIKAPIKYFKHHECHAYSSIFHTSWENGLCFVIDGIGDESTVSVYEFNQSKLKIIHKICFPHSVGTFYSAITQILGFRPDLDEYKVMGLAAFGEPKYTDRLEKVFIKSGKDFKLDMNYFLFHSDSNKFYSSDFSSLFLDIDLTEFQNKADIAASAQQILEKIVIQLIKDILIKFQDTQNIAFSGGVFQNCKLNQRIREQINVTNLFFSPISSDLGTCVGACSIYAKEFLGLRPKIDNLYLGQSFNSEDILNILKRLDIKFHKSKNVIEDAANFLNEDKVVAWFQGKSELGPRALGNRSIIANPSKKEVQERINSIIKNRELFRPFAPAILEQEVHNYFGISGYDHNFYYMIETVEAKEITENTAPAIVHIDNTSRIQIVSESSNEKFFKLLKSFFKKSGIPMVLNTSLNSKDEPIVNSPEEAINFFKKVDIDYLIINDFIISK